jgi:hypothetical protein
LITLIQLSRTDGNLASASAFDHTPIDPRGDPTETLPYITLSDLSNQEFDYLANTELPRTTLLLLALNDDHLVTIPRVLRRDRESPLNSS